MHIVVSGDDSEWNSFTAYPSSFYSSFTSTDAITDEKAYEPTIGDVVLVDSSDRRVRGTWIIHELAEDGRYEITRYGDSKATRYARENMTVKPIWLVNMVGAVVATIQSKNLHQYV